jgi:hypothetical protein
VKLSWDVWDGCGPNGIIRKILQKAIDTITKIVESRNELFVFKGVFFSFVCNFLWRQKLKQGRIVVYEMSARKHFSRII